MDGARDAVLQLEVHLGNRVLGEYGGIRDITWRKKYVSEVVSFSFPLCPCVESTHLGGGEEGESGKRRTDGSGLNHVADGESLDRLVLRSASRAVAATDGLDVAAALLVAAVVLSLLDHLGDWVSMQES